MRLIRRCRRLPKVLLGRNHAALGCLGHRFVQSRSEQEVLDLGRAASRPNFEVECCGEEAAGASVSPASEGLFRAPLFKAKQRAQNTKKPPARCRRLSFRPSESGKNPPRHRHAPYRWSRRSGLRFRSEGLRIRIQLGFREETGFRDEQGPPNRVPEGKLPQERRSSAHRQRRLPTPYTEQRARSPTGPHRGPFGPAATAAM